MKHKPEKKKDMDALREQLDKTKNVFLGRLREDDGQQDFELRKAVRGAGGDYKVVKNRIAEKAAEGTPARAICSRT